MRYKEWCVLLIIIAIAIISSNSIGYGKSIVESIPGALTLCIIAFLAVFLAKILPLKLPVIMYCSLLGLILSLPFSPLSSSILKSTGTIAFAAPLSIVGAYAGISHGKDYKKFIKQGWRMTLIALVVLTGTFLGSAFVAQMVLTYTNVI